MQIDTAHRGPPRWLRPLFTLAAGVPLLIIASLASAAPTTQPPTTPTPKASTPLSTEEKQPTDSTEPTDDETPELAEPLVQVTPKTLVFHARRWAPLRPFNPFNFKPATVTVFNTGDQPVSVRILGRQLTPKTTSLAAATGPISLHITQTIQPQPGIVAEFDTLDVPTGQPITLTVKPATTREAGVYTGSITVHLVQAVTSGNTENVTIPVKVVATDGPWWPFAVVLIGVFLATWTVNWRTTDRHKTLLHLRAAALKRRLSTMIADAHDQAFSERLATRIEEKLREAQRKWQELDLDAAQRELGEIETTLENYAEALALISDAEATLNRGREQFLFLGGDANRRLAGEAWLEEARIALDVGDVANARSRAEHALQVYGRAFGLYSRLKDYRTWIDRIVEEHGERLARVRLTAEQALRRADERIDGLTWVNEKVQTDEAERALTRISYWIRALEIVADAMVHVPADCQAGQRELEKAVGLLSTATVENVPVPRSEKHTDDLQKAEAAARAARKLCEVEPLLEDLALWFPESDGSDAWGKYAEARKELAKDDGDADRALTLARQAAVLHRLTELDRVAWRWDPGDRRHTALADAQWARAIEDWEAALRLLPWEASYRELADQLLDELSLVAECKGPGSDARDRASKASGDWPKVIRIVRDAMKRTGVQEALIAHYLFELQQLAGLKKGEEGWDELQTAQAGPKAHKPFASLGALKRALDRTPVQESVARALLAEVELVTHQPGDPGWGEMTQAREALENRNWARGLWCARFAWLDSRQALAEYYISEAEKVIGSPEDPGYAELQEARTNRDRRCWGQAVRHAREAWQQTKPGLAQEYVTQTRQQIPGWADEAQANQLLQENRYDRALNLALQALATHAIHDAEPQVTPGTLAWEALQEARLRRNEGRYAQALNAAKAAKVATEAKRKAEEIKPTEVGPEQLEQLFLSVVETEPLTRAAGNVSAFLQNLQEGRLQPYLTPSMGWEGQRRFEQFAAMVKSATPVPRDKLLNRAETSIRLLTDTYQQLEGRLKRLEQDGIPAGHPWHGLFNQRVEDARKALESDLPDLAQAEERIAQAERIRDYLNSRVELLSAIPEFLLQKTDNQAIQIGDFATADRELLTRWRLALEGELGALSARRSWKDVARQVLSDAGRRLQAGDITEAQDRLAQAADMINFLQTHADAINDAEEHIIASDDPGYPLLQEARAAFAQCDTMVSRRKLADAQHQSAPWRQEIDPSDVELICRNVELQNERPSKCRKGAPPIDEETSVDDVFHFEVRIKKVDPGQLVNYSFTWFVREDDEWSKREPPPGRAQNRLVVKFSKPGCKGIGVNIKHKVEEKRKLAGEEDAPALARWFVVRASRYSLWQQVFTRNSLLEMGLVVAIASLIGLNAKFYTTGVESFGSAADYLGALLWGATAKYGEEGFKSLPKLLGRVRGAVGSATTQASGGPGGKE